MDQKKPNVQVKEAFQRGLTELLILISAILFFFVIYKFNTIYNLVKGIVSTLMPVIVGLALAYLLNPVMTFFERFIVKNMDVRIKDKKKLASLARIVGIILSFVLLGFFIYLLGALVFPKIQENVNNLVNQVPIQWPKFMDWLEDLMKNNEGAREIIDRLTEEGTKFLTNWMKSDMLTQAKVLLTGVVGVFHAILNIFVGIIVAFYVLMSKETFKRQLKKVIYAFFSDDAAAMTIRILKKSDKIFGGFISGKIVDSLIIGFLCFIGLLILGMPYAVLVSVIVGVTNIVPFFGPYIGAVPSFFLILLDSPMKGLIFLVFILLLQQFDGNILGPKILGDSTGLSPFWVVFSILLFGGLFGVVGMVIGVPTFGVIYYLITSYINYRLRKKGKLGTEDFPVAESKGEV